MLVASALLLLRYCSRSLFLPAVEAVAALIIQRPKITLRREAAAAQVMEVARPRAMAVRAATAQVPGRVQVPGQALVAVRVLVLVQAQVLVQVQVQVQAQEAMAAEEPEQATRAVAEPLPQA
jgi:cell envelope opacity-associated protein A